MESRNVQLAVLLLKRGQPLPVDLQAELLEEGIDVQAFINNPTTTTTTESEQYDG